MRDGGGGGVCAWQGGGGGEWCGGCEVCGVRKELQDLRVLGVCQKVHFAEEVKLLGALVSWARYDAGWGGRTAWIVRKARFW